MTAPGFSPPLFDDALEVLAPGPADMMKLGAAVAGLVGPGDTVLLGGDLGAGKTTFVKGMAEALGVSGPVTSPTFVLVHSYRVSAGWDLLHADVWRLEQLQEVIDLAIPELLEEGAVAVIEWGQLAAPALAPDYLYIGIAFEPGLGPTGPGPAAAGPATRASASPAGMLDGGGTRQVVFVPYGPRWHARLGRLAEAVGA